MVVDYTTLITNARVAEQLKNDWNSHGHSPAEKKRTLRKVHIQTIEAAIEALFISFPRIW